MDDHTKEWMDLLVESGFYFNPTTDDLKNVISALVDERCTIQRLLKHVESMSRTTTPTDPKTILMNKLASYEVLQQVKFTDADERNIKLHKELREAIADAILSQKARTAQRQTEQETRFPRSDRQLNQRFENLTISGGNRVYSKTVKENISKGTAQLSYSVMRLFGLQLGSLVKCSGSDLWNHLDVPRSGRRSSKVWESFKLQKGNELDNAGPMNKFMMDYVDMQQLKLVDVKSSTNYILSIPLSDTETLTGRPDSIILQAEQQGITDETGKLNYSYAPAKLMVEYKINPKTVQKSCQSIFQLIGSLVQHPEPCVVLTTNLSCFKFTYLYGKEIKEVITNDSEEALAFVNDLVRTTRSVDNDVIQSVIDTSVRLWLSQTRTGKVHNTYYVDELPFERSDAQTLPSYCYDIEEALMTNSANGKPERGRSGQVHFVIVKAKDMSVKLAVKLHSYNGPRDILAEIENEVKVYHALGDNNEYELKLDGSVSWRPKMLYAGDLMNHNYFAVVTTYVGNALTTRSSSPTKIAACKSALQKLHEMKIVHGDVRHPNFAWSSESNTAAILDFGFSKLNGEPADYERDMFMFEQSFENKDN